MLNWPQEQDDDEEVEAEEVGWPPRNMIDKAARARGGGEIKEFRVRRCVGKKEPVGPRRGILDLCQNKCSDDEFRKCLCFER